jgi:hypothetical protein
MNPRCFRTALLAPALLAAAALPAAAQSKTEAPQPEVTRSSRPVRLIRSWEEPVKVNGGETARRVDVVFDYERGIGYQNFYTLEGAPIGRISLGPGHPAPSPEEIDEAFDVVRGDPEFAKIFKRFRVVFEGGFLLTEPGLRPCGPGSRCLRVFLLSSDRAGTIRQVVVDLVKQKVAYDDFAPGIRPR